MCRSSKLMPSLARTPPSARSRAACFSVRPHRQDARDRADQPELQLWSMFRDARHAQLMGARTSPLLVRGQASSSTRHGRQHSIITEADLLELVRFRGPACTADAQPSPSLSRSRAQCSAIKSAHIRQGDRAGVTASYSAVIAGNTQVRISQEECWRADAYKEVRASCQTSVLCWRHPSAMHHSML